MQKKLIIFDIGGVLSPGENSEDPFVIICSKYKISRDEFDKIFYKYFNDYHFNRTLSQYNFWKNVLTELNQKISDREIEEIINLFNNNVLSDVSTKMLKLLKDLCCKYKLVLLSNSFRDMDKSIFSSNYIRYFDRICLTHLNSKKKPLKEAYLESIFGFNVKPGECLIIDDKLRNIDGAKEAGIDGILFKDFENLIKELKKQEIL
jgi:HAD superfamily hydrolase (TIGR01509 family)